MDNEIKILLVEDNEVNQHLVVRILRSCGLGADLAKNGREALEKVVQTRYDIIFMDIQMPEMDGLTATKLIRQQFSAGKRPKIIAITAVDDIQQYLAAGMDECLTKPIQVDELIALVEKYSQSIVTNKQDAVIAEKRPATDAIRIDISDNPTKSIDPKVLREFQAIMGEDGAKDVEHLISLFIKDAVVLWNAMVKTVKESEYEGLARAAHTLKGNSFQVGATLLAEYCKSLEDAVRHSSQESILKEMKRIKDELLRVLTDLRNFRPQ